MQIKKPKLLLGSIVVSQLAGVIGSLATTPNITTWYALLNKPDFNPPNWLFGPVWLSLYTLMGIALYLVIISQNKQRGFAIKLFLVHLVVNSLWSIVFFGFKQLGIALLIICLLWLMIAGLIKIFSQINRLAGSLLWPYLLWVSFAGLLNWSIWQLN